MRVILLIAASVLAGGAGAQTKNADLTGGVAVSVTLEILETGPGFSVIVAIPEGNLEYSRDVYMALAMAELRAFLAEHRWCMSGFAIIQSDDIASSVRLGGRCE